MIGEGSHSYLQWKSLATKKHSGPIPVDTVSQQEGRHRYLLEKYGRKWHAKVKKSASIQHDLPDEEWLRQLLFTPSNRGARQMACTMVQSLCQV